MDDLPDRDLVSIIDVAQRLGVFKQTVFKAIKRLGITASKVRDSSRRNQLSSFITTEEEQRVVTELANACHAENILGVVRELLSPGRDGPTARPLPRT